MFPSLIYFFNFYSRADDFNFTNQYIGTDSDFDIKKVGRTAEDTIYAYSDIKLKKYQKAIASLKFLFIT